MSASYPQDPAPLLGSNSARIGRRPVPTALIALIILAALALVIWKPWRPSVEEFMRVDPHGYAACNAVDASRGAGGKTYGSYIDLADQEAAQSTSETIRAIWDEAALKSPTGPRWGDLGKMGDACEQAGFKFRN